MHFAATAFGAPTNKISGVAAQALTDVNTTMRTYSNSLQTLRHLEIPPPIESPPFLINQLVDKVDGHRRSFDENDRRTR